MRNLIKTLIKISIILIVIFSSLTKAISSQKYLLNQLEIYYNQNNIPEFKNTMDKLIQEVMYNNQDTQITQLIKDKFLKKSYQNPFLLEYLADCLFTLNDIESSAQIYKKIISQINTSSKINQSIVSRLYSKIANNSLLSGDIQEYFNNLNNSYIYETDPEKKINLKLQIIKEKLSYNLIDEKQIKKEINEIAPQIKNLPPEGQSKAYITLAEIYNNTNLKEERYNLIKNIISQYNLPEALILQLEITNDKNKKIEILEKLIEQNPKIDPYYQEQLANLYLEQNQKEKAINIFEKIINIIPTKHSVIFKLALLYFEQNNYFLAKRYIDLALKLSNEPSYLELAGDIYSNIDPQKAIQYYQEAISSYQDIESKAKVRKKLVDLKNK